MNKGDIVLIPFPFTDLSGNKNRLAVVLVDIEESVTVCFITSQLNRQLEYDILLEPSELNGLKKTSLIRLNKIAAIDKFLTLGRLGTLERHYIQNLDINLMKMLKIKSQANH